jgi:hypothetical protein
MPKISKKGKGVYTEAGLWLEEDGSIHLTFRGFKGFHVAVNADPKRPNAAAFTRGRSGVKHAWLPKPAEECLATDDNFVSTSAAMEVLGHHRGAFSAFRCGDPSTRIALEICIYCRPKRACDATTAAIRKNTRNRVSVPEASC